jgi:hypothetical protein
MPFGEIFQTISLCKQTGVLTLTDSKGAAKLVFSQGKLFYASCDNMNPFGHVLVKKGVITSEELENALAVQRSNETNTPIADILEKTGVVSKDILQVELKKHLVSVVRTLLGWEEGLFHFDFGLRVEKGILLEDGLNLPALLIEATRPVDSWRSELQTDTTETPAERGEWSLFTSMASELVGTTSTNEVLLLFFRYASEVLNRCAIFLVKKKELVGMGQSGLQFGNENADERIKKVRVSLLEPSIFKEVIERSGGYRGPLSEAQEHKQFVSQIGGSWPSEVFVVPLFDGKSTVAVLYGDNLPNQTPLSDTRGLEAFVKIAGVAYAKAALEKKLAERKGGALPNE